MEFSQLESYRGKSVIWTLVGPLNMKRAFIQPADPQALLAIFPFDETCQLTGKNCTGGTLIVELVCHGEGLIQKGPSFDEAIYTISLPPSGVFQFPVASNWCLRPDGSIGTLHFNIRGLNFESELADSASFSVWSLRRAQILQIPPNAQYLPEAAR